VPRSLTSSWAAGSLPVCSASQLPRTPHPRTRDRRMLCAPAPWLVFLELSLQLRLVSRSLKKTNDF
jgi:hypothetical protein